MRLGLGYEEGVPVIAIASKLAEQKGLDLVIEALPELMKLDIKLCILGEGDPVIVRGKALGDPGVFVVVVPGAESPVDEDFFGIASLCDFGGVVFGFVLVLPRGRVGPKTLGCGFPGHGYYEESRENRHPEGGLHEHSPVISQPIRLDFEIHWIQSIWHVNALFGG